MNKLNDKDLREALRRHEAKRPKPQVSEDFCDKVMQALTEPESSEQPKRRQVWLYPIIGAAATVVLLFSLGIAFKNQDGEKSSLVAQTDTMIVVPQTDTKKVEEHPIEKKENTEMFDSLKKVKEIIQMSKTPRHYMARGSGDGSLTPSSKKNWVREPSPDPAELAERTIAEEERRLEMEMMAAMNGSVQAEFQKMTREIRQRGERMTRQAEIAINDDKY